MVHTRERVRKNSAKEKEKEWFVSYTNINGLVLTLSEINNYLRTKKPDMFSLLETKLNDSEDVPVRKGQYNVWRQTRNKIESETE